MPTSEFFSSRLAAELPAFSRVIRALPADQLHYKPHERSTGAGALAQQIADELHDLVEVMEKAEIHYEPGAAGALDDIAAAFDANSQKALATVKGVSEQQWNAPAKFYMGGKSVWEASVGEMAWGILFDLIHHRGQLSAYIRPMGGKVPSIYGPSADDNG